MPKLYEYFGLTVMFYANEHELIHVHGKCQGRESKAEIMVLNGMVTEIRYSDVAGRAPLEFREFKPFLAHARHPDLRVYLDPAMFSTFRIEYGELVWGDYDLCFPIIDLYRINWNIIPIRKLPPPDDDR